MNAIEMKRHVGKAALLVFIGASIGRTGHQTPGEAESAIRAARARFNAAIAAHDSAGLDRDWADSITVIASRGGVSSGRAAYARALIGDFHTRPGLIYVRTPRTISFPVPWGMATEEGDWTGSWAGADGVPVHVGGRYIARWRLVTGHWLLNAEMFGLLNCSGDRFCREAP